ncbi:hypothetical protein TI39_contig606g00017 [Zymoseptoria brevis]|uniref:Uncharacterized protein n=1 Tax=Zymoseptoria brevis TaxID=1047168 RepID=A0A0F4GH40_9PEZI|nr:hypothetical protein TI39_contig606g00017 [Zymoseptoria brevis]
MSDKLIVNGKFIRRKDPLTVPLHVTPAIKDDRVKSKLVIDKPWLRHTAPVINTIHIRSQHRRLSLNFRYSRPVPLKPSLIPRQRRTCGPSSSRRERLWRGARSRWREALSRRFFCEKTLDKT